MTTILVQGIRGDIDAALRALAAYAAAHPQDATLRAWSEPGCACCNRDLRLLLGAGIGELGSTVDNACAELLARAGIEVQTVPQYLVHADAESGLWAEEPVLVGRVDMSRWHYRQDTPDAHFDHALIHGEEAAVEVRWLA